MTIKFTREVERFGVRSDDGSYETVVVITQDFVDAGTLDEPSAVLPGMRHARTIDGLRCNSDGPDRFRIVGQDIVVTRKR